MIILAFYLGFAEDPTRRLPEKFLNLKVKGKERNVLSHCKHWEPQLRLSASPGRTGPRLLHAAIILKAFRHFSGVPSHANLSTRRQLTILFVYL